MPTKTLVETVAETMHPLERWARNCHAASLHLVKAEVLPEPARVARGVGNGIGAQHSWVVLGTDCYDKEAIIIDPTLWSYDDSVEGVWVGTLADGRHYPHGLGNIFEWGRPPAAVGAGVELKPRQPFSSEAELFLELLGPLDEAGWRMLCSAPVQGWPAGEVFDAIIETFEWGLAVLPIDIVGMVTNRNPSGLYLAGEADQ